MSEIGAAFGRDRTTVGHACNVVEDRRDDAAFEAWVSSPAFAHGHRSEAVGSGAEAQRPVGVHSELWSYTVAGGSSAS